MKKPMKIVNGEETAVDGAGSFVVFLNGFVPLSTELFMELARSGTKS